MVSFLFVFGVCSGWLIRRISIMLPAVFLPFEDLPMQFVPKALLTTHTTLMAMSSSPSANRDPSDLPRELRFRLSPLHSRDQLYLVLYLVATPIVLVAFAAWLLLPELDELKREDLLRTVVQELDVAPATVAGLIGVGLGIGLVWWFVRSMQSGSLRLTSNGIEMRQPGWIGPALMRQSGGNWRVGWHEITAARLALPRLKLLQPAQRIGQSRLVLDTPYGEKWLHSFLWVDPENDHRLRLRQMLFSRDLDVGQRLRQTPLVQALRARGIEVESDASGARPAAAGYDLSAHPGMLAMLVLFALAAGYAALDTFFLGRFKPLEPLPLSPLYLAALAGVVLAALLGKGAPTWERTAVGALLVVALVAAARPGMLRYNAMTAAPLDVTYTAVAPGVFGPPTADLPDIDLRAENVPEYWERFPAGSEHEFTLLRGAGGFYQLDPAPLYRNTRAFYRQR